MFSDVNFCICSYNETVRDFLSSTNFLIELLSIVMYKNQHRFSKVQIFTNGGVHSSESAAGVRRQGTPQRVQPMPQ